MKKQILKNIIHAGYRAAYWIPIFLSVGCQGFLDELPDNRMDPNKVETVYDLMPRFYSSSARFSMTMTDNAGSSPHLSKSVRDNEMYQWKDGTTAGDLTKQFWLATYNKIAHNNTALDILRKRKSSIETDRFKRDKKTIEGVALVARAYNHFMLVNLFAKHYNKSTAARDLGVPYIKKPETKFIVHYRRHTVEQVYQWIEEDLLKGLPLIEDAFFTRNKRPLKYHFNKAAARAFASRYYLFKGEYDSCIQYSNQILGANPAAYIKDLTSATKYPLGRNQVKDYVSSYYDLSFSGNLFLASGWSLSNEEGYGLTIPIAASLYAVLLPPPVSGKYPSGYSPVSYHARFDIGYTTPPIGFQDVRLKAVIDYGEEFYKILPWYEMYNNSVLVFRGEEVLLNRAEAYLLKSPSDIPKALADLQLLADRRYVKPTTMPSGFPTELKLTLPTIKTFMEAYLGKRGMTDTQAILQYILWERRKEFMFQGLRWLDIKRHRLRVLHTLAAGQQAVKEILTPNDPRKAWQIPLSAVAVNRLKPNPR